MSTRPSVRTSARSAGPSSPSPSPRGDARDGYVDRPSFGAGAEGWAARALLGLSIVGAVWALASATHWANSRQEMIDLLASSGVARAQPELARRVERETTPHHARLSTARGLVLHVLNLSSAEASEEEWQAAVEGLPRARELATEALGEQPNSWQAAMLAGTATYLDWSVRRDSRLYTEARAWEEPLEKAVADARGHPEPARLLATAYLETWPGLSAAKRERARALLAQVFHDDLRAFEALAPAWTMVSESTDETFSVVPERPEAWSIMARANAAAARWPAFRIAHERYLDALESTLDAQRLEAEERLRLGDFYRARSMLLKVIVQAPPSGRFAPLVDRALEVYPPGLHGLAATRQLEAWIEWSLELSRVGIEPLPPAAIGRLLDAVGEIEPHVAAGAAQLADDLYQAVRFEKLARPLTLASWAPYLVAKADHLLDLGRVDEAREALSQVATVARSELPYNLVRLRLSRALGDTVTAAIAETRLDELRRSEWTALEWRWRRNRPALELLAAEPSVGLVVEMARVADKGAVVEFRWDGKAVATEIVGPGTEVYLPIEVSAGPHLLELMALAGGEAVPGAVRQASAVGRP